MNLVALIGNLASEPELFTSSNGTRVCMFRLAVSRPGGDSADFFDIRCTDRPAEICAEYLQCGRRVGIEGRISTIGSVHVVANRVELLGKNNHVPQEGA